jgi:hypothetical protein
MTLMTHGNDSFLFTRFLIPFPRIIVPYSCLIGKTALAGPRVDFSLGLLLVYKC